MKCSKCGTEADAKRCPVCDEPLDVGGEAEMNSFFEAAEVNMTKNKEIKKKKEAFLKSKFSKVNLFFIVQLITLFKIHWSFKKSTKTFHNKQHHSFYQLIVSYKIKFKHAFHKEACKIRLTRKFHFELITLKGNIYKSC